MTTQHCIPEGRAVGRLPAATERLPAPAPILPQPWGSKLAVRELRAAIEAGQGKSP